MKIRLYKKLICYFFIAILFASGMHVNIDESHSFFACESNTSSETPQYSNSKTFISSDYCSTELLQTRNNQYIRNNSVKRSLVRRLKTFTPFYSLLTINKTKFYFEEHQKTSLCCSSSSQIVIIEYIHRQDGAK